MARLWSSGFELNSTSGSATYIEWEHDNSGSTPTIQSSTVRSGSYAAQYTGFSGTTRQGNMFDYANPAPSSAVYTRAYVRFATFPGVTTKIMFIGPYNTAVTYSCSISVNSSGQLRLLDGPDSIGSLSSALSLNTWYMLELMQDRTPASGARVVEARIDGVSFASITTSTRSGTGGRFGLGRQDPASSNTVGEWFFDDVAINDTSGSVQNSWPGAGSIVHLRPNAAGDNNNALSGDYTDLDEVTPDDTTTKVVLDANNDVIDVNVDSSATPGIPSDAIISLVQVGARMATVGGSASIVNTRIKSAASGTVVDGSAVTLADATYKTNTAARPFVYGLTSYTDPTTAVAWTATGTNSLDNMQIGMISTDATPDVNLTALWALVEYYPNTADDHTIITQDISLTLNEDNATINQNHVVAAQDISHSLTEDGTTVSTGTTLSTDLIEFTFGVAGGTIDPQDVSLGLTLDATTIAQNHITATQDISNGVTLDATTVTQNHVITPDDVAFGVQADNGGTSQNHVIVAQDIEHGLTVDNSTFMQNYTLASNDISHGVTLDNTTLSSNYVISAQDIAHSLTVDTTAFIQNHNLVLQDIVHGITLDSSTIIPDVNVSVYTGSPSGISTNPIDNIVFDEDLINGAITLTVNDQHNIVFDEGELTSIQMEDSTRMSIS